MVELMFSYYKEKAKVVDEKAHACVLIYNSICTRYTRLNLYTRTVVNLKDKSNYLIITHISLIKKLCVFFISNYLYVIVIFHY